MHIINYHISACIPFTCMYGGVRATGVFFDVLALDYNYPSHILTEPGKIFPPEFVGLQADQPAYCCTSVPLQCDNCLHIGEVWW